MTRVGVIGAGLMGHGLAMVFALGRHPVILQDVSAAALSNARRLIASSLSTLAEAGMFDLAEQSDVVDRRITFTQELTAVAEADLIVEAITESKDAKQHLFCELDKILSPQAIIASNTSFLNIFELVPERRQANSVIAHWFAPPHIIDLVEIVPGPHTAKPVVAMVQELLAALGKKPIVLPEFISGFIGNRLQAALNLEVFHLLDSGYATPEMIDAAVIHGLALRMPILGHLRKADFAGLELVQRALVNRTYSPPEVRGRSDSLDELVNRGHTGVMAGKGFYEYGTRTPEQLFRERDLRLLAVKKLLAQLGEMR